MILPGKIIKRLSLLLFVFISQLAAAQPGVGKAPGTYTIQNGKLRMVLDCNRKAAITAMWINGTVVVNASDGMFSTVTVGGQTYSSLRLLKKPVVTALASGIIVSGIEYGDKSLTVSETWHFTISKQKVDWRIERKFSNDASLAFTASPVINFNSINTWDGAVQGYGGLAWFYLFKDKPCSYGVHSRSSAFWTNRNKNGLYVTVTSPGNEVGMTYTRTADDRLSYQISVSPKMLVPRLDSGINRRLFIRGNGAVWSPLEMKKGVMVQDVVFSYMDNDQKYDRGTLPGVNGKQVAAVLNTIARIGVIDSLHYGGNSWATPYGPICLHEQYIGLLGLGINDPQYLKGYQSCLDFYRDHAFKPDGRVYPRWAYNNEDAAPGQYNKDGFYEAQWGVLMDSNPDYVANVADLFNQTGDTRWVRGQQHACERALDWILARDKNNNGLVEMMDGNQDEQKSSDWIDIVWAAYENAFVNAKLYHALVKWGAIEHVLGNSAKARDYENFAAKLKESFNKPTSQGGFWDEEKQCYIHWRDDKNTIHGLNMVTPVNFMAIAYGICDQRERQKAILDAIEKQMQKEKLFFWPITMTSYAPGECRKDQLPFPNYENGDMFLSWGSIGVAAYAKYNPAIALKYVRNVLAQYGKDGLAFQRYARADQSGQGDDILAGNSLAIIGLYQSIYGINPLFNRLLIDPHLTPDLNGTELKYNYQGKQLGIKLSANRYAVTDGRFTVTANNKFGYQSNQDNLYFFNGDRNALSMNVMHKGKLSLSIATWDTDIKTWTAEIGVHDKSEIMYPIFQLKPNTSYQYILNGKSMGTVKSDANGNLLIMRLKPAVKERITLRII